MLTNPTKPNLLLVEDSEDDAFFFQRTLQKCGVSCSVSHVTNGAEAVSFLQNASKSNPQTFPQVIFLDLKMPVMNGFDVLDWLGKQTFSADIRVFVLSGSEHQNDKERAIQLGAAGYLVKPIRAIDLGDILRDICPAKAEIGART